MTLNEKLKLDALTYHHLIKEAKCPKEKAHHFFFWTMKGIFTLLFCTGFIIGYGKLFGTINNTTGVAILLCILSFAQTDFDLSLPYALTGIILYYAMLFFAPIIANSLPLPIRLLLNLGILFSLYVFGCSKPNYYNHSILVLGYLLVYGTIAPKSATLPRLYSLILGALLSISIYYRHHKMSSCRTFRDCLQEFSVQNERSLWQLLSTLTVCFCLGLGEGLHLIKPVWGAIAAMSILSPNKEERSQKMRERLLGTLLGMGLFMLAGFLLPPKLFPFLGSFCGFLLTYCTSYLFKVPLNTCGGLLSALETYPYHLTLTFRMVQNLLGALLCVVISLVLETILLRFFNKNDNAI